MEKAAAQLQPPLQFTALRDDDGQLWLVVWSRGDVLDAAHSQHAVDHLAEH